MTGSVGVFQDSSRQKIAGMEAARFYAASSIMLFHLTVMSDLPTNILSIYILNYAAMGVPLFFIISAMGMCIGYFGKLETEGSIKDFYMRRFLRIATFFYVMMLLYIIMLPVFGDSGPTLGQFLASATFTMNLVPSYVEGYVWGSWTIGVEMIFYLLFPVLIVLASNLRRALVIFIGATVLATLWRNEFVDVKGPLQSFGNFFIVVQFHYFAAGIVAFHVWRIAVRLCPARVRLIGLILLVISCAATVSLVVFGFWLIFAAGVFTSWKLNHTIVYFLWATVLATFTIGMCLAPTKLLSSSLVCHWGRASFGIYLWHPPVIAGYSKLGIYRAIFALANENAEVSFLLGALLTFATVVPLSLASFRFIEKPGMALLQLKHGRGAGQPERGGSR